MLRPTDGVLGTVAVIAVAATLSGCGESSSPQPSVKPVAPVGLSRSGLRTLASKVGQPIYWAGPKKGYLYELTRTANGNVFVRYLPPGARVGTRKPYLTIATYPYPHALRALKNVANGRKHALPGGGIALFNEKSPTSVHLAYPGVNYQAEVYDPSPARSLQVALSGHVRPVR
jgi:hypothetical protein